MFQKNGMRCGYQDVIANDHPGFHLAENIKIEIVSDTSLKLSTKYRQIYDMLAACGQRTIGDLARFTNTSPSTVKRRIKYLVKEEHIMHEGPSRGGFYKIISRLN